MMAKRRARAVGAVGHGAVGHGAVDGATRWLHRSYRTGAVIDGLAAIGMVFPGPLWTDGFEAPFDRNRPELTYGMRAGAPLMTGWMLLLLWADRRPMQRKGVLPLTCIVLLGLMANDSAAAHAGQVRIARRQPVRLLQTALLGLFAASYLRARAAEARRDR
jgi:hypothetical protein